MGAVADGHHAAALLIHTGGNRLSRAEALKGDLLQILTCRRSWHLSWNASGCSLGIRLIPNSALVCSDLPKALDPEPSN